MGSEFDKTGIFCLMGRMLCWMVAATFLVFAMGSLSGATEPKSGGTLVFGAENDFAGFDLLKARGFAICDAIAMNTIMERLFDSDETGELIPVLGLSAEPSEDGKTWTIKLRQGVSFHDGTPFNADAVVHHWSRILDPANRFRGRSNVQPVQAVEKIDAFTVRFKLAHAWLPFPKILTETRGLTMFIPSPKAVEADVQLRAPVGTGPFMFKEWKSGDQFVVGKNPRYWRENEPYLNDIIFKLLPDHQTRFASLKSGQMDMIWMDRGNIIEQARNDPALVVRQGEGNGAEIFVLNTTKPPLDDPNVRRAIAFAWNQEACVAASYRNAIPVAHHPLGRDIDCKDVNYPDHDLKQAAVLLEAHSVPIELECLHSNTKRGREQGELLQQFCKKIGVAINPVGLSFGPVIKKVITKDYQISTWRLPSYTDPGPALFGAFHSQSRLNVTGYNNPKMDELLAAQRIETDPVKRNRLFCEIAGIINRDVPILYRGGRAFHVISRPRVKGAREIENGVVQLAGAWLDK